MRKIKWLVFAALAILLAVNIMGCATASTYMKKEDLTRTYDASRKEVFDAVIASAEGLKWKVESTDPDSGIVKLHPPLNLLTSSLANAMQGGDLLEVKLETLQGNRTRVAAEQISRGEIMDFGRAAGNINTLFRSLDAKLAGKRS